MTVGVPHFRAQHVFQTRVRLNNRVLVVFAARHSALIGDHEQHEVVLEQKLQRLRYARKNLNLIGITQVASVVDEGSVSVKKDRRPQSGLAISGAHTTTAGFDLEKCKCGTLSPKHVPMARPAEINP